MNEKKEVDHYKFPDLSDSIERDLAIILGKITHHIHPSIVRYITQANIQYRLKFENICHDLCKTSSFFYPNSDCVFPGFRRPVNSEKIGQWKNHVYEPDGTILNDNTFPRHIWSYLSMNRGYAGGSAGMWASSGLDKFELAHIFAHKQNERNLEKEIFREFNNDCEPYGLFTSASNVVLIPKGFAKPTDHMKSIKICFYKRHIDLYGNNLIGLGDFDCSQLPNWYSDVKWLDPCLPSKWEQRINALLEYRERFLRAKYKG